MNRSVLEHLYGNELDKACFAHDAAYSHRKDVAKINISDKILKDRAYEIAAYCRYDGYQRALASMVCNFFDKKTGSETTVNEQLAEELHNPITKKLKIRKALRDLKTIFGWLEDLAGKNHCFQRIKMLNIYYVS